MDILRSSRSTLLAIRVRATLAATARATTALAIMALAITALAMMGCGGETAPATGTAGSGESAGEVVEPPFPVRGELEGLVLTWFDAEGVHTAERRADVPEAARAQVRVDSLSLSPEQRDPESVFVADLRSAGEDGRYVVRRLPRDAFEERVRTARAPVAGEAASSGEVIVFGASWCGACRQAEAFLRERGVAFVERDIEEDPAARQDMIRRARAAGIQPDGIPIIDVRGRVLQGFDAAALDRALRETGGTPPTVGPATGAGQGVTI
jgi:glutaredoxin